MKMGLHIIGHKETVSFPTLGVKNLLAKVDTGADVSSIWCGSIKKVNGKLECIFFAPQSPFYTGKVIVFSGDQFRRTIIANSFGHKEPRYKVKIPVSIGGRRIRASFTLADRSKKKYPVLIGRQLLAKKFIVDVAASLNPRTNLKKIRNKF